MTLEESLPAAPFASAQPNWLEQDDKLRALWLEHKTPEEIGTILGRSVAAIMTRAARLGLPRRAAPGRKRGYKRSEAEVRQRKVRIKLSRSRPSLGEAELAEGARPATVKMRICLMCLQKFESEGSHNRICPACKGSADYSTGSSTPDFVFDVGK